jgi:hypothetical protein
VPEESIDDEVLEGSNGSGAVGGRSGRQRVAGGGWWPYPPRHRELGE